MTPASGAAQPPQCPLPVARCPLAAAAAAAAVPRPDTGPDRRDARAAPADRCCAVRLAQEARSRSRSRSPNFDSCILCGDVTARFGAGARLPPMSADVRRPAPTSANKRLALAAERPFAADDTAVQADEHPAQVGAPRTPSRRQASRRLTFCRASKDPMPSENSARRMHHAAQSAGGLFQHVADMLRSSRHVPMRTDLPPHRSLS